MSLIRNIFTGLFCIASFSAAIAQNTKEKEVKLVSSFKGQQVTGIAVSAESGRIFANFPRWNDGIIASVVEVFEDGTYKAYPDKDWNGLQLNKSDLSEPYIEVDKSSVFVAVQSVYAFENKLYVLDTRNPFWQGVEDAPRIFVFDLASNELEDILIFEKGSFAFNSYANDLRIDKKNQLIIVTDSNDAALMVYDLETRKSKRVLHKHLSTIAEKDHLLIDGEKWTNTVHSDGIAFRDGKVYYHALTGHNLYALESALLKEDISDEALAKSVEFVKYTAAPDGMIFDEKGNLFFADLEHLAIMYMQPDGNIKFLSRDKKIGWADSFAIHKGYLYFTNSKIHEKGDVSERDFPIYKIYIGDL